MSHPERLGPGDTLFLDIESGVNTMNVGACLVFERAAGEDVEVPLDFDRIVEFLASRVARQDRYRQRIVFSPIGDTPEWVEAPSFDIRRHVRHTMLPHGSGEQELKAYCAVFANERLDTSHPMWAVRIVEGFAPRRFAFVIKAHHSLVDGIAGITLLEALLTPAPLREFSAAEPIPSARVESRLSRLTRELGERLGAIEDLARNTAGLLRHPSETIRRIAEWAPGFRQVLRDQSNPPSPTPLDAPNSPRRALDWRETPLDRIAEIRSHCGGTLNDVAAATLTLALTEQLERDGIPVAEQKEMEIRIAIPVNMRGEESPSEIGNRISMLFARVPVGETHPLAVLDRTRESLAAVKASHASDALGSLLDLADWTPRPVARQLVRWAVGSSPANLVLTNIPGPTDTLYLLESPLLAIHPVVPLMPGQALAVAVLSYAGQLDWAFHADPAHFEDLAGWSSRVDQAFERLHRAATETQ